MSSLGNTTLPAPRRTRKSVGGQSPSNKKMEKENATIDVGGTLAANRKKSRSKSMGPGGLDVLRVGSGNRRVVRSHSKIFNI
jgi:kinetochore protein Spc7/SPC105